MRSTGRFSVDPHYVKIKDGVVIILLSYRVSHRKHLREGCVIREGSIKHGGIANIIHTYQSAKARRYPRLQSLPPAGAFYLTAELWSGRLVDLRE